MLIGMSSYGKVPDPVIALARDAARTLPGPPVGGAQALAGQPPRLFASERAMWLLRPEAKPKAVPPGLAAEPVFGGAFNEMLREKGLEGSPNWAQGNQILGLGLTTYGCYWKWFGSEKVSAISRCFCLFEGIFGVVDLLSNHPSLQSMKPAWDQVKAWLTVVVVVYKTGEEVLEMRDGKVKKPREIVVRASDPSVKRLLEELRAYKDPLQPVALPARPQTAAKGAAGPAA
jgi:hypothetical protein